MENSPPSRQHLSPAGYLQLVAVRRTRDDNQERQ